MLIYVQEHLWTKLNDFNTIKTNGYNELWAMQKVTKKRFNNTKRIEFRGI